MIHRLARKKVRPSQVRCYGELKAEICPYCGKRGFYNISGKYERCQCCGLHRVSRHRS